jgi:DNA-binding HxlR family transcriptional regulator
MKQDIRSDCPINIALEIFGDKWSLLVVRDIIFADKIAYNEFLDSKEKIATNILSNRLKMLEEAGIIQKRHDSTRKTKTKFVYLLTPMGIDLIPTLVEIMLWSEKHRPWCVAPPSILEKAHRNKSQLIKELRQKTAQRITSP